MIEIRNIYKKYKKDYLFENFSISFYDKKITSIIGPSGGGKTTLLRMMAGLEPYEGGEVTGIDRKNLAYVFQEDRLLPWLTVAQNIELVLKAKFTHAQADQRIKDVLSLLDLEDVAEAMPAELSGGMKRRVAIGRALAYDGELILLDEPFKGMDDKLKKRILDKLKTAWKNGEKTIILVTHDLEDARKLSDVVYELSGRPLKKMVL